MIDRTPTSEYQRATRLVTSRRVKQEQTTILRQSLLFGGGALFLLILAVVFVIPGVIRLVGALSGSVDNEEDLLPPQVPLLSAPIQATSSASLQLAGFTSPKAKVFVLKNGSEDQQVDADDSGNFTVTLLLSDGENIISAYAKNDDLESEVSQEYTTLYDNEQPKLEITEPVDGQTVQGKKNQTVTVKGTTESKSRVYLNDRLVFAGEDGSFSTSHRLNPGENTLTFRVVDQAGNVTDQEMKVNFQE
jgi:hypothetical protein